MYNNIMVGGAATITPMQAQQVGISPAVYRGEPGKAPRIGANGTWEVFNNRTGEWEDTGVSISGGGSTPIATKEQAGIVKPGEEFVVGEDGTLSLNAVETTKIAGLDERLSAIEKAVVGQDLSSYVTRNEVQTVAKPVAYEIAYKPEGALVNYSDGEIRILCPSDTQWSLQQSGENADPNSYYIGFKAYAPKQDVVGFKEDLGEMITDTTLYSFDGNEFAGIDEYGRKYSIVWLPVAAYDAESDTWSYHGERSTAEKQVGWYYSVEWYNAAGVRVAVDRIRINLTNEGCHTSSVPYYVANLQSSIEAQEESTTWEDM